MDFISTLINLKMYEKTLEIISWISEKKGIFFPHLISKALNKTQMLALNWANCFNMYKLFPKP
jgi:hypothetical protein